MQNFCKWAGVVKLAKDPLLKQHTLPKFLMNLRTILIRYKALNLEITSKEEIVDYKYLLPSEVK